MGQDRPVHFAVMVGSLRKGSFNAAIARALPTLAPEGVTIAPLPSVGEFPLYNYDVQLEGFPPVVTRTAEAIRKADGIIIVTPENNHSIPGVLKNAIDVASRPYGQSVFNGKPGGVISNSPGAIGGFGANHHIRQSLAFLNVPVLQQPEAYVGGIGDAFDANGELIKDSLKQFATGYINAFAAWVDLVLKK